MLSMNWFLRVGAKEKDSKKKLEFDLFSLKKILLKNFYCMFWGNCKKSSFYSIFIY